jgi:uncharacterized SAM-binding protein YcdF (DUF218 family)
VTLFGGKWKRRLIRWAIVAGVLVAFYLARGVLLPPVAQFLDVSETPTKVDYVLVLGGGYDTRPFVAAALFTHGQTDKILVPTVKRSPEAKDGIVLADHDGICQVLRARGVPEEAIVLLPSEVSSTYDEAAALRRFLESHPDCSVAVVTNKFHTRRALMLFGRVLGDRAAQVHFVGAPTDGFDASNWWQTEDGFVCYANEYVKLLLYTFRA